MWSSRHPNTSWCPPEAGMHERRPHPTGSRVPAPISNTSTHICPLLRSQQRSNTFHLSVHTADAVTYHQWGGGARAGAAAVEAAAQLQLGRRSTHLLVHSKQYSAFVIEDQTRLVARVTLRGGFGRVQIMITMIELPARTCPVTKKYRCYKITRIRFPQHNNIQSTPHHLTLNRLSSLRERVGHVDAVREREPKDRPVVDVGRHLVFKPVQVFPRRQREPAARRLVLSSMASVD